MNVNYDNQLICEGSSYCPTIANFPSSHSLGELKIANESPFFTSNGISVQIQIPWTDVTMDPSCFMNVSKCWITI